MAAVERRPYPDPPVGGTMDGDEALRLLANTRRTLLKLVSKIDEAIGTVESQRERGERAPTIAR